jgi:alpha-tubulin suppressor-like RCC1 family protein
VGSSNNTDDRFSVGQVSSGQYHNVAVTAKGAVYTFGGIEEGCLGRGGCEYGVDNMPRPVPGLQRIFVSQVSAWRNIPVDSPLVVSRKSEWSTFLL